ncbi:MAG: ATP-binding cassette domain-containing protein [Nitrospiraceae bacterium]|nr:ATP-binding cassette domain-containing protein [Nitrospiraceae bacterium]
MIRLDNLSKHFRKGDTVVHALEKVSIEVPQGQLALLRGPSGSGKTTIINVVAGLTRPTSGTVAVGGQDLGALNSRERTALRAKSIAVVFQMFHLVPYLTTLDNVLLPTLAAPSADAGTRARQLLDELGMTPRVNHLPRELSAGERQRCAMARAILNRPDVILADEPTGNLDEESAAHVLGMLAASKAEGATVLVVSHQHIDSIPADVEFELRGGRLLNGPQ